MNTRNALPFAVALLASCSPTRLDLPLLSDGGYADVAAADRAPTVDAGPSGTACASDRDCSAMGMVCDLDTSRCVGCNAQTDCAAGLTCFRRACHAVVRCTSSTMCPAQVCSTRLGFCVDCVGDNDCPSAQRCSESVCVDRPRPCSSDRECSPMGMVCNGPLAHCVACNADTDCPAGRYCDASNTCARQVCTPSETTCPDLSHQSTCRPNGSQLVVDECAPGQTCREGRCQATTCAPGSASCDASSGLRRVCNPDGASYTSATCPAGRSCSGGVCVAQACVPGSSTCADLRTSSVCNPDGLGRTEVACPAMASCVGTMCSSWTCTPGSATCASSTSRSLCGADGVGVTTVACPTPAHATAPRCSGMGACGYDCAPGFGDCDGDAANGCEASLATSSANCGACGRPCGAAPLNGAVACVAGVCQVACGPGYAAAGGLCVDACLTNNGGCDAHASCGHGPAGVTCACQGSYAGDGRTCANVAGSLSGRRWELPCIGAHGWVCSCASVPVSERVTFGGAPGVNYDVVLRFRGAVEARTYYGGTRSGFWYVGGSTPSRSDANNIYSLGVSSPAQQFYLNAQPAGMGYLASLDYQQTVRVAAGATLTLTVDGVDGAQLANHDAAGTPMVIAGVPPAPAAFDGQFIQMDVISVTPR